MEDSGRWVSEETPSLIEAIESLGCLSGKCGGRGIQLAVAYINLKFRNGVRAGHTHLGIIEGI